jgi:exodeoxyribonuclease VII small subunit
MNFEEKVKKLEEISLKMENPDLTMTDGVDLYEQGVGLAKECFAELNNVKGKINVIRKDLDAFREESLD